MTTTAVKTPWGDSDTLRDRRLSPGPGASAEDVARNQRERLLAAMIASVSERGYAATRVNDLVALSGVSTRSFYALFKDKEALLLDTIDALLAVATKAITTAAAARTDWAAAAIERCAELLVEHPASGRVCLVDSLGAGPRVRARLAEAMARLEDSIAASAAAASVVVPPELVSAWLGGLLGLGRIRLADRTEEEIPRAFAEFATVFRSYEPPECPLRLAARPPSPPAESIEGHDHADRAVRAFTSVLAERGYWEASVEETLRRGSMSARTFYANFAGKDDVLLAAIDSAGAQVVSATMLAFRRADDWAPSVRAALGAFFNVLAFRPEMARLLLIEYAGGGTDAIRRRAKALRPLERLLDGGLRREPVMPARAGEVMVSCLLALATRVMAERGAGALPALAPICTHLLLAPFIGSAAASEVANGDGSARRDAEHQEFLEQMVREPLPYRVAQLVAETPMAARRIAAELGQPEEAIARELQALEAAMHLEVVGEEGGQPVYRSTMRFIPTEELERMDLAARARVSARILEMIEVEVALATRSGSFDARPERSLVHLRGDIDERGWEELGRILDTATHAAMRTVADAEARVAEGEEKPLAVRGALLLFELPEAE